MLRTWLRTIYSSLLDLSTWSEASSWHGRNLIKAQHMSAQFFSIILLHTKSFEDHNRPHIPLFTMFFNKSIISFVAAIALASSVAATSLPVCKTGVLMCCDSTQSFSSLSAELQHYLKLLDPNVNPDLPVGEDCDPDTAQHW
jgi:hypothetical protein